MRKLLVCLTLLLVSAFAQCSLRIDWETSFRYTAIGNGLMDTYQTCSFMQNEDIGERNPLVKPLFDLKNQPLFAAAAVGVIYLTDRGIGSIRDKNLRVLAYLAWASLELTVVNQNFRRYNTGFPVVWVQVRW